MIRSVLSIYLIVLCAASVAQDSGEPSSTASSDRKTILRELVVQDRGEITAIEPSSKDDGSVIVGYSSGVVLTCEIEQECRPFHGTPNVSVEHIAVSRRGVSEIVWVTYRQGALYLCVDSSCVKHTR